MGVKGRLAGPAPGRGDRPGAAATGLADIAVSAATVTPVPTTERRLSAVAATSRKYDVSVVLGAAIEQASPQRRWQVTALRLPWVLPDMGSRVRVGLGDTGIGARLRGRGRCRPTLVTRCRPPMGRQVDVG